MPYQQVNIGAVHTGCLSQLHIPCPAQITTELCLNVHVTHSSFTPGYISVENVVCFMLRWAGETRLIFSGKQINEDDELVYHANNK